MKYFNPILILFLFLLSSLFVVPVSAQHLYGEAARKVNADASQIIIHHLRNNISFIRVDDSKSINPASAKNWLLKDVLKARTDDDDLISYNKFSDKMGLSHERFRQYYKGIPVENGVYYVHSKNGRVVSANGEWYDKIDVPTNVLISGDNAYAAALNDIHAKVYRHEWEDADNNQLMITSVNGSFKLVYRCDVYAIDPYKRLYVYVDAQTGNVVKEQSRIQNESVYGTAHTEYSGVRTIGTDSLAPNSYRLREYFRGAGVETYDYSNNNADYYDTDNDWVVYNILDIIAYDAHFGAEATYDFYDNNFGWKSVDGQGQQKLISYAHNNGAGPINAFWDGTAMNYGDGDPQGGIGALTSLDVCGHELTHGVTQNSSNLTYSGESGGLNESFSDISGITIRFLNIPNSTWLIDDQEGFAFRDMSNPKVFNCPDTYNGDFWNYGDGVHFNSGVQNFWYYLLVEGGTGVNDVGENYSVQGIGLMDAIQIAFRNNTVYLTPNSDYQDARDYAVQAAIDLFGDCSNQVIQTANAWYAVNVGDPYSGAVSAQFTAPQTSYCSSPATVTFDNASFNASTYLWDFGDGNTSTETNPSHEYDSPGTYTVMLTATNDASCNVSNSITLTDYITVGNSGAPLAPECTPTTQQSPGYFGIYRFILNTIDNKTDADDDYQDYSCSQTTQLVAGTKYPVTIFTNGDVFYENPAENVRVWIDYNNDGVFDDVNEVAFAKDNDSCIITGYIQVPMTTVQNAPLRLRVMDDKKSSAITGSCFNPKSGQCEDYGVTIVPATTAPVADFTGYPTGIDIGETVNFTDFSTNGPTSWQWTFEGGTPSASTSEDPSGILYANAGSYDVTLIVSNDFGSDTITKEDYVLVNPAFDLCEYTTSTYNEGGFFDPGGVFDKYDNNENCSLLISPACAGPITISIPEFESQATNDALKIYDGADDNAPLLATVSGNPDLPFTVTSSTGLMFVTWTTDGSTVKDGFYAQWTSLEGGLEIPVANFSASNYTPPFGIPVGFTDLSSNLPIYWSWDFGDGATSNQQNPSHVYADGGTYTVTLIVSNCGGSDTITQTINAQSAPVFTVEPNEINVDLMCGTATASADVTVTNNGSGDLIYGQTETEYAFQGTQPDILALTYGADLTEEYPNTLHAIDLYFPDYALTATSTEDGEGLAAALSGHNTFLMTRASGTPSTYSNYATALSNFVNAGGTVIFCGTVSGKVDCIFNTGLLSGSYGENAEGLPLNVLDTNDPLALGLSDVIASGPKNSYTLNITNNDFTKVIEYNGNTVVGYRNVGAGKVIYIGFDYKVNDDANANLVMGNAIIWVNNTLIPDWITVNPTVGTTLSSGSSQVIHVDIDATGVPDGTYTEYLIFSTNDPNHPFDSVPIIVNVNATSCVSMNSDIQCQGNVCFTDSVYGGATSVLWDFGDGSISTEEDPCHVYTASGPYSVSLIACGDFGCDTLYSNVVIGLVSANITTVGDYFAGNPIDFFSNAENAVSYSWDFGDGFTSTQENPQHTYTNDGEYTVTLTVTDATGCTFTTTFDVVILPVGIDQSSAQFNVSLYPNPANEQSYLEYTLPSSTIVKAELWNAAGQKMYDLVSNQQQVAGNYVIPVKMNEAGNYFVHMIADGKSLWLKLENVK